MKEFFPLVIASMLFAVFCAHGEPPDPRAQEPQRKPDTSAPGASPMQSSNAGSRGSQMNPQELARLSQVADKVLNRIQNEENDLYLRVSYFEKPSRLDPTSYGSKDEIAKWEEILGELKEKHDLVSQLYADVGKNLDTELRKAGVNELVVIRFKNYVLDGFPWETINKKKELISEFIDQQAKLLSFYAKNWGSWNSTGDPANPEFTSVSAANIYKRLRDQILTTSKEIEKEYKELSEQN